MTTCHTYEEQFSDALEDRLEADARAPFDAHLARCPECRAAFDSFVAATAALRSLRVAPTPEGHVDEVLRAVAGRGAAPVARPLWARLRPLASHAAALLLGLSLALGAGLLDRAEPEIVTVREEVEVPVEVVREVPVDRVVEVVREVPVEVVREVPVDRVVTQIQYVDREVPAALQADVDRYLAALLELSGAASDLAFAAALEAERRLVDDAQRARSLEDFVDPRFLAATEPPTPERSAPERTARARLAASPVTVVREEGRVRIRTRGSLHEVVPALIGMLEDPDAAVAHTAERHLEALRGGLGEGEPLEAEPPRSDRVLGGVRGWLASDSRTGEAEPEPTSPRERWQTWWSGARADVAGSSGASAPGAL